MSKEQEIALCKPEEVQLEQVIGGSAVVEIGHNEQEQLNQTANPEEISRSKFVRGYKPQSEPPLEQTELPPIR